MMCIYELGTLRQVQPVHDLPDGHGPALRPALLPHPRAHVAQPGPPLAVRPARRECELESSTRRKATGGVPDHQAPFAPQILRCQPFEILVLACSQARKNALLGIPFSILNTYEHSVNRRRS